jgi:hypothetical protein
LDYAFSNNDERKTIEMHFHSKVYFENVFIWSFFHRTSREFFAGGRMHSLCIAVVAMTAQNVLA